MESPFLNKKKIIENENAFAIYDGFPVSKGHVLVIPKRVVAEIFDLNDEEYSSCFNLVKDVKINKFPRGRQKPSDHTPIEIELT